MNSVILQLARRLIPGWAKRRFAPRGLDGLRLSPPVGWVRFGSLRRLEPISRNWGADRGRAIDRFYIQRFLEQHKQDVRGRVLEIGDDAYTRRFGEGRVTHSDVLHISALPQATIVGDLADMPHVPDDTFDCLIVTQTLQLIYDFRAAVRTCHRVLKPGGVVLATVPGITPICHSDRWGEVWQYSFTKLSARTMFEEVFPKAAVEVESHGNVLASIGFLHGLAMKELTTAELEHHDRDYQLNITIRAVKEGARPAGEVGV